MKLALFYDDLESGEGVILRGFIDENTAYMRDGQHFDYGHSVLMENMECPRCHSNHRLVFKGDNPNLVSNGYVGACTHCDEDFYLIELIKNKKEWENGTN